MWTLKEVMNEKDFSSMISGKRLLYIPIVSSIDRETGEYKLDADGNINRMCTTFLRNHTMEYLILVLPMKAKNARHILDRFEDELSDKAPDVNLRKLYNPYFGIHAGEQRKDMFTIINMLDWIASTVDLSTFDYIIADSQYLLQFLIDYKNIDQNKLIFWNYLCSTEKNSRSYTKELKHITEEMMIRCGHTIVTSPEICEYAMNILPSYRHDNSIIYIPNFVDVKTETFGKYDVDCETMDKIGQCRSQRKHIIFLPFRLTDEAYQIDLVAEFISKYRKKCQSIDEDAVLMYSDPNNSGMMPQFLEKYKDKIGEIETINVSSDRNTFYTIINNYVWKVNIPYFENIEYANHAAIWEFKNMNCNVWVLPKFAGRNNPYYESTDTNLFLDWELL